MAGVGEHHLLEHHRLLERQRLADHAADGKADVARALDAKLLHQPEHVVRQHFQRIRTRRRRARAMAAHVVVEDAEATLEGRDLRVPHAHRAGERVAQDQPRRALLAAQFKVDLGAIDLRLHASSTIRGIIISSSCVPPWLPMCSQRGSPGVQSFTVYRSRITSATSPMRSAKRGCGSPGPNPPSSTSCPLGITSARSPRQSWALFAKSPGAFTWQVATPRSPHNWKFYWGKRNP